MIRRAPQRLLDIQSACDAIQTYLAADPAVDEGMTFDAIRMNILVIGEAVKNIPAEVLALEPGVQWADIAAMRDRVAHRYFDTAHAIVVSVARNRVPELRAAVERLLADPAMA